MAPPVKFKPKADPWVGILDRMAKTDRKGGKPKGKGKRAGKGGGS